LLVKGVSARTPLVEGVTSHKKLLDTLAVLWQPETKR